MPNFSLSPAVETREAQITTSLPSVAVGVGGTAGNFKWGPVGEPRTITSENELVEQYGQPDASVFEDWFSAKNFLSYSNNLLIVRASGAAGVNGADVAPTRVENLDYWNANQTAINLAGNTFISKYPGTFGNDIVVHTSDNSGFVGWAYENEFEFEPTGTEVAVVVLLSSEIVETFIVDETAGSKDAFGNNNFLDVINIASSYIWCDTSNAVFTGAESWTMSAGTDVAPSAGELQSAADLLNDPDQYDVNYLFVGSGGVTQGNYLVQNVAESRKDCIAIVPPDRASVMSSNSPITDLSTIITNEIADKTVASSYGFFSPNYKYQYDKYNDVYGWINYSGDVAGLMARKDFTNDPWWSPAGENRGQIKNVVRSAYQPRKADRDNLYKNGLNPIMAIRGAGTYLYGDKTMQAVPGPFSRVNVRSLFILIEKSIATAASAKMFEFNDDFTRTLFRNELNPYLRDIQARRGIYDFRVICDTTNNTDVVIDANGFVGDIYIKPAKTINAIRLTFNAVDSSVDFEEILV